MLAGILNASQEHVYGQSRPDDWQPQSALSDEDLLRILNIKKARDHRECRGYGHIKGNSFSVLKVTQLKFEDRTEGMPVIRTSLQRPLVKVGRKLQQHRPNGSANDFRALLTLKLCTDHGKCMLFNQLKQCAVCDQGNFKGLGQTIPYLAIRQCGKKAGIDHHGIGSRKRAQPTLTLAKVNSSLDANPRIDLRDQRSRESHVWNPASIYTGSETDDVESDSPTCHHDEILTSADP